MLKNLLKISIRNILKDKGYGVINVLGLTLGITCSVFLLMYVSDELSYDRYHANADNIYRVVSNIQEPDNAFTWAVAQVPLAEELRDNYPQVANAIRFFQIGRVLYSYDDKSFYEEDFYLADSLVFDMFSYDFIRGNPDNALDKPNQIVVTESIAMKYFDTIDCLGKTFKDAENEPLSVTGVIKDVPYNSHFRFDALVSRSTVPRWQGNWGSFGVYTYLQFPKDYDPAYFQQHFDSILTQKVNPIFESIGITINYELQNIKDIHLYSKIQDETEEGGDISYVYIFSGIAIFILIIASINYMNLATARSTKRAKEVGVRKVMGAYKRHLVAQFITESVLMSLVSLLLSLGLIYLLLPGFNMLANKQLTFGYILEPNIMMLVLGVVVFVGLIAGSYPALYLSKFNPVSVLKGKLSKQGGNVMLRKALVVLQFSISIFMLIATMIAYDQLNYLMSKDLGFDKSQVIKVEIPERSMRPMMNGLKNELLKLKDVANVATASTTPGENVVKRIFHVEDNEGKMSERGIDNYSCDYDYINTLKMSIIQGRNFDRHIPNDTLGSVLVNEQMVKRMGWTNPLGKKFEARRRDTVFTMSVIGVVRDYHQNSLYDPIEPIMIRLRENSSYLYAKINTNDIPQTMGNITNAWSGIYPNHPFEYSFLDQDFDTQYAADKRRGIVFMVFSILTIIIACLGLLGLTSYTTEQRTKEIGIRKVIGASVQNIVMLVSKEFIGLVIIATIIACPISWYFMQKWLEAFAYKIVLSDEFVTFALSAGIAMLITILTVGFHSAKAATLNPVDALKDE